MKRFLIYGSLFCLVALSFSQNSYADPNNWLDVLNFYRGMAGLPPVVEDKAWSKECDELAKYMVQYGDNCTGHIVTDSKHLYLNPVAQDSNLTYGQVRTDREVVEGWIRTPYHGLSLLSPALHTVGFGSHTGKVSNKNSADNGYTLTAGALNVTRGAGAIPSTVKYPTYFPGDGSYMPLWGFGTNETPNPFLHCPAGYSGSSGPTISLRTNDGSTKGDVTSHSLRENGVKIDHCLLDAKGAIVIIPKNQLKQGKDYKVSIKVKDNAYEWSFTTKVNRMWLGENILWRNSKTGENVIYQMDGYKVKSFESWYESIIASGGCPGNRCEPFYFSGWDTNWEIVGTADFDNDGYTDIVWRNAKNGQNAIIYMESKTDSRVLRDLPSESDVNWEIVGTGDFNDDYRVDIFWHNPRTGANRIWLMDRGELLSEVGALGTGDTNWTVVAAGGNFKYERGADLLWRNIVSGANAVWYMAGTKFFGDMDYIVGQPDLAWKIAAIGYFDDDDRPDILWRHDWGFNAIWYMEYKDGYLSFKGSDWLGNVWIHPDWKVGGMGRFQ